MRRWLGWLLLVSGVGLLVWGGWVARRGQWSTQVVRELRIGRDTLPAVPTRYPLQAVITYRVASPTRASAFLSAGAYRVDGSKTSSWVVLPGHSTDEQQDMARPEWDPQNPRADIWATAATKLKENAEANALIMTWWDNAQRVRLYTGLETLVAGPAAGAFSDTKERELWLAIAHGFNGDPALSKALAMCLSGPASQGKSCLQKLVPADRPAYVLVTVDDLLRAQEFIALGGQPLHVRTATFPLTGDMHGVIGQVRDWAGTQGGGYLVQQINANTVRAWAVDANEQQRSLLTALLPFSASLMAPLPELDLVYQSAWGGYLSIYRLKPDPVPAKS